MVADILRFNRDAPRATQNGSSQDTLGDYLHGADYSRSFIDHYLIPMGSAIWSVPRAQVFDMPAAFFVRFFENHGMLQVSGRPEWRVVQGGSGRYVEALIRPFADRIFVDNPVRHVARHPDHVTIDGHSFDHVILACHSDQALAMLADPSRVEREILGAFPYQPNDVVLHTDTTLLPERRRAWAAWNYRIGGADDSPAIVTYNMNMLQSLDAPQTFCVTLNSTESVDSNRVLHRVRYHHPIYSDAGFRAQRRHAEISGTNRTHYCGAYWGNGFHEDGVRSALTACRDLEVRL
jgi:predicted NAD/FAD-binding protein